MKTHTHTPGPWYPVKLGASPDHSWAIDGELHEVARLPEWTDNQAEAEANARLISAAPELLDACKAALAMFKGQFPLEHGNPELGATWGALEDAIIKAEGGDS